MFSYAGIVALASFYGKFYAFFAALDCGAYFLALVGIVTNVIGRWAVRGADPQQGRAVYRDGDDKDLSVLELRRE